MIVLLKIHTVSNIFSKIYLKGIRDIPICGPQSEKGQGGMKESGNSFLVGDKSGRDI